MPEILWSRWGVQLEGDAYDVANLQFKLNGSIESPVSPFVAMFDRVAILRCARWNAAPDFAALKQLATQDLRLVVACMCALDPSSDVTIGTLFEFDSDDRFVNRMRETPITISHRRPLEERATPAAFRMLTLASSNDAIDLALRELSPEPDWFDIYRTLEALMRFYSGGEPALFNRFNDVRGRIQLMKRTANSYRHTEGKFAPVTNPMPIEEARELIRTLLISAASEVPQPYVSDRSARFAIKNHKFDARAVIALNRLTVELEQQP